MRTQNLLGKQSSMLHKYMIISLHLVRQLGSHPVTNTIWWESFGFGTWISLNGTVFSCTLDWNDTHQGAWLFSDMGLEGCHPQIIYSSLVSGRCYKNSPVCVSVWVCWTYVVHHIVGKGLHCAPPTCIVHHQPCIVHHWPMLCTMVHTLSCLNHMTYDYEMNNRFRLFFQK